MCGLGFGAVLAGRERLKSVTGQRHIRVTVFGSPDVVLYKLSLIWAEVTLLVSTKTKSTRVFGVLPVQMCVTI